MACVSAHLRDQLVCLLVEEIKSYCVKNTLPFEAIAEKYGNFQCSSIPSKSISDFFTGISYSSHCSSEALILSVRFLSKVKFKKPDLPVDSYTIHRLMLTCLLLAIKVHDDMYVSNADYGKCCGLPDVKEINAMEAKLLMMLDYEVYVSGAEYAEWFEEVVINNAFAKGLGIDSSVFIACSPRLIREQKPCSPVSQLPPSFFTDPNFSEPKLVDLFQEKPKEEVKLKEEIKLQKPILRKPIVRLASRSSLCCFSEQDHF